MSSPPALGFYAKSSAKPPATVTGRRWKGVNWGGDGSPEGFGVMVLDGIRKCGGDLKLFVDDWIVKADSGGEEIPYAVRSSSENDIGNTAYCYVLDVENRRLDVFGTYAGAEGVLLGSLVIDLAGVAEPPTFAHLKRPRGWQPEDELPDEADIAQRIEEAVARHSACLSLDVSRARATLLRASELEAKANSRWRPGGARGPAEMPSLYSFWHAANEFGLSRSEVVRLMDGVVADILQQRVPTCRFMLGCDPIEDRDPKFWAFMLEREVSPEERRAAIGDPRLRLGLATPYMAYDWCEPFLAWAASRPADAAEVDLRAPLLHLGDDSFESVRTAIEGVVGAHSLTAEQLIEGFGELFEELLLLETWKTSAEGEEGERLDEWPEEWNPVVVGGSCGRSPPDGQVRLGGVSLIYSKRGSEQWPHWVLFRADGARAWPRLTPFSLAKQGPRRLGDTKAVLRDVFVALGSVIEGAPVKLDDRGVVSIQRDGKWEPILFSANWWLSFLRFIDGIQN
jgi:hypothetical protein